MKRSWWLAAAGGVIAGLWIFGFFLDRDPPLALLRIVAPTAKGAIDLHGGMRGVYRLPLASAEAKARAIHALTAWGQARTPGAEAFLDGDLVTLDLPGVNAAEANALAQVRGSGSELEFKAVVEGSEAMRKLADLARDDDGAHAAGIATDTDAWSAEDGAQYTDVYLHAHDRAALAGWLAGHTPALIDADHQILLEERRPAGGGEPDFRTYYVERQAVLDSRSIASAVAQDDKYSNRPEVMIAFDEAGGKRFGDATAAMRGHKLAIVVDGQVMSAPVIMGAIRGGRASITMGAGSRAETQANAERLAANLRSGPLPAGLVEGSFAAVYPTVGEGSIATVRIAGAVAVGLLVFLLLAVALPRHPVGEVATAPTPATTTTSSGWPWGRLLFTLAAPVAAFAGYWIRLPGLDTATLQNIGYGRGDGQLSVFALGVMPFLSAFLLVELAALIVPPWRRLRNGGPDGRAKLAVPTAILGVVIACVQAWLIIKWLAGVPANGPFGGGELLPYGLWPQMLIGVTLVTGSVVLVALAALVSRFGLANGYAALILPGLVLGVVTKNGNGPAITHAAVVLAVAGVGAVVLLMGRILGGRVRHAPRGPGYRLPVSSLVPLGQASSILFLVVQLAVVGLEIPGGFMQLINPQTTTYRILDLGLIVGLALLFGFLFTRRRPAVQVPAGAAIVWSVLVLVALRGVEELSGAFGDGLVVHSVAIAGLVAIVIDLVAEWRARARLGDLVDVWPLHRVQLAGVVEDALAAAGIPAYLRSSRARSLLRFFGPFVPVSVLVPPAHAATAAEVIRKIMSEPTAV